MRKRSVRCQHCDKDYETGLAPGKMAKCKHCGEANQVAFQSEVGEVTVFPCPECKAEIQTKSPAGKKVKCKACEKKVRVPLKEQVLALRSLECAQCNEVFETSVKPGQDTDCPHCGQSQRVPLEVPLPTFQRVSKVSRRCPDCDAKVLGSIKLCPDCGIDIDRAIKEQRYGHSNAGIQAYDAHPSSTLNKIVEGRFGIVGSALVALIGLGVCAKSIGDGYVIPKFLISGVITFLIGFVGFCFSLQKRFQS